MERLCFGTFIDVLVTGISKRFHKTPFVTAIIQTVDPKTTYVDINNKDKSFNDAGYRSLNHLYKCTGDFSSQYTDVLKMASKADAEMVCQKFEQDIVPCIDLDKYALIVLALCGIIEKDPTLDNRKNGENANKFKQYVGKDVKSLLDNTEFILSEFLSGVFLYTINGAKNNDGKEWLDSITKNYKKYDDYFEKYTNSFIEQKNTIKVFPTRGVQKEQSIVNINHIGAEISNEKQYKVCFFCKNWNNKIKKVRNYTKNIDGICELYNRNTLSSESCPDFDPNYSKMGLHSLYEKIPQSILHYIL